MSCTLCSLLKWSFSALDNSTELKLEFLFNLVKKMVKCFRLRTLVFNNLLLWNLHDWLIQNWKYFSILLTLQPTFPLEFKLGSHFFAILNRAMDNNYWFSKENFLYWMLLCKMIRVDLLILAGNLKHDLECFVIFPATCPNCGFMYCIKFTLLFKFFMEKNIFN